MSERDPSDVQAEQEADAAAAEAGSIGGRAPDDEDPAARPVEEAGGGESEGFEQAEEELREQASHGDPGTSPSQDEFSPEQESDLETADHGEPDQASHGERSEEQSVSRTAPSGRLPAVAKQKQVKMQMQVGALAAIPQLESRTDEQLQSESKHRVAAKAILGARAAERYDADTARRFFNEALAGCHPQERPALRQLMKASLAQAERRPDELKEALEKMGQAPPSSRQLFLLRMMGLVAPPKSAGALARVRGILLVIALVLVLIALGFGLAKLVALPFGGVGTGGALLLGLLIVSVALGVLVLLGRRRQARMREARGSPS